MPDNYEHDVFFSYRRNKLVIDWSVEVVHRLTFWLSQELDRDAKIFFDIECVEVGDRWPDRLRTAIQASRCMVCIWSPMYFRSPWCVSEWKSFLERERRLGLGPYGLIAPVRFHDGSHFPEEASQVQSADFSAYTSTIPAFWQSQRAVEFEDLLKGFSRAVAQVVIRTPPFQADWPVVEAEPLPDPPVDLRRL